MNAADVTKQMIEFNKTTFENSFNAVVMLQDQTEKMTNAVIAQMPYLPEEGKKAINEWVKVYKKGRDDFKKAVDENFKKAEDIFKITK